MDFLTQYEWDAIAASFGPVLKEAFPASDAISRMRVADALCDEVRKREGWFTRLQATDEAVATNDPWWDVVRGVNYLARAHELRDRALVAAEYRLSASPHEWTADDSEAMARFIPEALGAMEQMRRETIALMSLLASARSKTA